MNLKYKVLTFLFVLVFNTLQAQDKELLDSRIKNYLAEESSQVKGFRKIVSWDLKMNVYTEFFTRMPRTNYFIVNSTGDTVTRQNALFAVSILSCGFEPRFNLIQNDKNAFGIKLSTFLNLSAVGHSISDGFMHGSQGVYVFFGRGFSGPFNNLDESGFAISSGLLSVFAPFVWDGKERDNFLNQFTPLPGSENYTKRMSYMPTVQFDFYRNRPANKRQKVTSLTAGYFSKSYFLRFSFGYSF